MDNQLLKDKNQKGPGSNTGKCCGITVGIKANTRKPFIATEDWTKPAVDQGKHMYLCGGSKSGMKAPDCMGMPVNIPIYLTTNKVLFKKFNFNAGGTVQLLWIHL